MPNCPNCGQSLPDEARFCANCGRPMPGAGPAPSEAQVQPPQPVAMPQPTPATVPVAAIPQRARTMAMLCHLSAFLGFIGIPLGNILAPLLIWLLTKEEHPFIDHNGKESLNFQISIIIFAIISAILILLIVGIFMLIALWVYGVIAVILGAIRAANGEHYRYPLSFRFIK